MSKLSYTLIIAFLMPFAVQAQESISAEELTKSISYLASDELAGRKPGTKGDTLAAEFIRDHFQKSGAKLLFLDGFQEFEVTTGVHAGENNKLVCRDFSAIPKQDFIPVGFSANASLKAPVAFAGYGLSFSNDTLKWDDYQGIEVKGKWAIIMRGDPMPGSNDSPFIPFSSERDKVLAAKDNGAKGVIFVDGASTAKTDEMREMNFDKSITDAGIPVLQAKRFVIDQIIAPSGKTVTEIEKQTIENFEPQSFECKSPVEGQAEVLRDELTTFNVGAWIEGSDEKLKNEYIVVGAHYDHLGMGGYGSGSRMPDTNAVHNGADDNASGVAAVMELAEQIGSLDTKPDRSIIFLAFGAEEMGLLGSKYFIEHLPVPADQIKAMINMDMIGRLKRDNMRISIGGTGTAQESKEILEQLLKNSELSAGMSPEGFGPSDHAAFYGENIPVFFISTGAHSDYHTPMDDVEFIDADGAELVSNFVYQLLDTLSDKSTRLTFQEAGPSKNKARHGYSFKVTFGIMPDFTAEAGEGMSVGGVRPGGPAHSAGMLKGDRIVAIDGKKVADIYEYMARLKKLKAGQIVTVDVLRNGKKEVLIIQL